MSNYAAQRESVDSQLGLSSSTSSTTRTVVNSKDSPQSPLYSQAIKAGNTLYLSGLIGFTTQREMAGPSIEEQTHQIFKNLQAVLKEGGSSMDQLVKVNIFLLSMNDYAAVNEIYSKMFPNQPPARTCIAVVGLPFNAKIEIDAVALVPQ